MALWPTGASRLHGDRAREVEATDKAWEGRRKDESQPAELLGLKIAAAPACAVLLKGSF